PISDSLTTINVAAPLHYQHQIGTGLSYMLAPNVSLNGAYTYYLPHTMTGPLLTPLGPVPGSSVSSTISAHVASFGITVKY
ncbi:MAG TPA: hypothetical protein PLV92_23615, partial [Pirellulaceae bacterium]|nr:hypothetical protein [Pirellulaceae bacterium]